MQANGLLTVVRGLGGLGFWGFGLRVQGLRVSGLGFCAWDLGPAFVADLKAMTHDVRGTAAGRTSKADVWGPGKCRCSSRAPLLDRV